jgi:BlaI family transcriptional regulator, penicillinase repressor
MFTGLTKKSGFYLGRYEDFVDLRKVRRGWKIYSYMEKLSQQEEEAMQAVWKTGEGNLKLFLDNMEEPGPPYTTLASTIKNLEKKGYLSSRLIGSAYLYKVLISEEEYKRKFMSGFVKDYFANSYKELVNFFVKEKKLSTGELKEIIDGIGRAGDRPAG